MALERALFLRQQADLISAQENLRQSADLVTQPGKKAEVADLMLQATQALESGDKKAGEGKMILDSLSQVGFIDVPLSTFAERLRLTPPVPGEGAIARIVGEASQIEDEQAIQETEKGLMQMRQGNREGFRSSSQKAAEHSAKAEEIAKIGTKLVEEVGDFSLNDLADDLVIPEPDLTEKKDAEILDNPEKSDKPEQKEILKRGERVYITLRKALDLDMHPDGVAPTFKEVIYRTWEDKAGDRSEAEVVGYYRSTFKKDLAKGLELLREGAETSQSFHPDIKPLFEELRQDPKIRALSDSELEILGSRKAGWEAILAKLKDETTTGTPEQGPTKLDIGNTPIAIIMQKIQNGELQQHDPVPKQITELTSFQERIWWRAFDLVRENGHIIGFKNETFDDVLHDIYSREIGLDIPIPSSKKLRVEEKIIELSQSLILALDHHAAGIRIPKKIESILSDFGTPILEAFSWLTPLEITQVIKREIDFEQASKIVMERWSASLPPEQADAYLQKVTGE